MDLSFREFYESEWKCCEFKFSAYHSLVESCAELNLIEFGRSYGN